MNEQPPRIANPQWAGKGGAFRSLVDRRAAKAPRLPMHGSERAEFWDAIGSAVDAGLGVLLSRTSDGGAVSIVVYEGSERHRTYCSDEQELDAAREAILDLITAKQVIPRR